MSMMIHPQHKKIAAFAAGIVLCAGLIFTVFVFSSHEAIAPSEAPELEMTEGTSGTSATDTDTGSEDISSDDRVAVEGMTACLPKKDTDGPVTLECAIGLTTDSGTSYALDFSASGESPVLDTAERVRVEGVLFTPESFPRVSTYDIKAVMMVSRVIYLDDPTR